MNPHTRFICTLSVCLMGWGGPALFAAVPISVQPAPQAETALNEDVLDENVIPSGSGIDSPLAAVKRQSSEQAEEEYEDTGYDDSGEDCGNVKEYFDKHGRRTKKEIYDDEGRLLKRWEYDHDKVGCGKNKQVVERIQKFWEYRYDENGCLRSYRYEDWDKKHHGGFNVEGYIYTAHKKRIAKYEYDVNENNIKYHYRKYDRHGNLLIEKRWNQKNGCFEYARKYFYECGRKKSVAHFNEDGQIIQCAFYDRHERLTEEVRYDDCGNIVQRTVYEYKSSRRCHKKDDPYKKTVIEYDEYPCVKSTTVYFWKHGCWIKVPC